MIENLFIITFLLSVLMLYFAIDERSNKSLFYSLISLLFLITTLASALYIEVPGIDDPFSELGFQGLLIGLIFINIIIMIATFMMNRTSRSF